MSLFAKDTIAAFATSPAGGAVALLRISGPGALNALYKLSNKKTFTPRRATLIKIHDGQDTLDSALAVTFPGPNSYSGEDSAEITLHASPYIKARVLELLAAHGVRPAKGGEFSLRAFLNGKMDLAQAQGVADIIASKNKAAHKAAMHALEGKLSAKFGALRAAITNLLAQAEVRLDDSDGEMPPLAPAADIKNILGQITALAATFSAGRMVKDGVKIALAGAPNSGKSSMLNALLGYDRAIVSPTPGTTRDSVDADFEISGLRMVLTDTAGIRDHSLDPAEKEGMLRTRRAAQNADIVIFVKDISAPPQQDLYGELSRGKAKIITAANKADLAPSYEAQGGEVKISSLTGMGIEELKNKIIQAAGLAALHEDDAIITSAAHHAALLAAAGELELALNSAQNLELLAEHLRAALRRLKELIGEVTTDDILGVIFSQFCVGK